jgi:glycerophosphoryl diester phosphodiesterase
MPHLPRLPRIIAHRCGGSLAPENTLAGLRASIALGCAGVEFDVMLSGDGTPCLIHDETLERTTNGHGKVAETPDPRLFSLDAGNGESIPRLDAALTLCAGHGLWVNLEVKPASGQEVRTAEAIAACLPGLWPQPENILLSSFSQPALAVLQKTLPHYPRGLLCESVPPDWPQRLRALEAGSLHCAAAAVSDSLLAAARAHAVPVLCYTVNDPAQAEDLLQRGVSALFTDRPERLAHLSHR